jgi:hypothetical protein
MPRPLEDEPEHIDWLIDTEWFAIEWPRRASIPRLMGFPDLHFFCWAKPTLRTDGGCDLDSRPPRTNEFTACQQQPEIGLKPAV